MTLRSTLPRWRPSASKILVRKPSRPCFLMKRDACRPPRGHRGVAPCPLQGGCIIEGRLRCCRDIARRCGLGTLWLSERGTGLGFIICYCPEMKVLGDWFSPICVGVGQPDNSCYFSPGLLVRFHRADRGSQVDFRSQSWAVFTRWGP
jgi:hypothetical protein